jgi:hypothetical protein
MHFHKLRPCNYLLTWIIPEPEKIVPNPCGSDNTAANPTLKLSLIIIKDFLFIRESEFPGNIYYSINLAKQKLNRTLSVHLTKLLISNPDLHLVCTLKVH